MKQKSLTINVLDVSGHILQTSKLDDVSGKQAIAYDLSKLAKGVYYVQIISEDGSVTKKMVIE